MTNFGALGSKFLDEVFVENMLMMLNGILRRRIKIQVPWDFTFLSILSIVHLYEKLLIHKFMSSMENRRWLLFEIFTYISFPFLKTLFPSTFPNGWVPTSNIIYYYCFTFVTNSKYNYLSTYFDRMLPNFQKVLFKKVVYIYKIPPCIQLP